MSYGVFDQLEASQSEHRIAANAAEKDLDVAILAVRRRHAAYLNGATGQDDFFYRVALVKDDMRKVVEAHGIHPRQGIMRRVVNACRNEARPLWRQRQAAEGGTQVDDAANPAGVAAPIGVLDDSPIGAVTARRRHATGYETQPLMGATEIGNEDVQPEIGGAVTAGFRDFLEQGVRGLSEGFEAPPQEGGFMGEILRGLDDGVEQGLPPEKHRPQHPPLPRGTEDDPWQQHLMEGLQSGIGQGMPKDAAFRQLLAEADRMSGGGLADAPPLIPEGDFDAYLNQVTGPETDAASDRPFGGELGNDRWENTARRRQGEAKQDYAHGGRDAYDFTGSPETQHHHRALPEGHWNAINDIDVDEMYARQKAGQPLWPVAVLQDSATRYARWALANRARPAAVATLRRYASVVPLEEYTKVLGAVRLTHDIRRTAAGKDHLQTSQDSITKMLNELAEDFQKSIMPLQDALQSVQFAQQTMQAQSPMNVMPPGSVNVLPPGMDPAAGGAPVDPAMQGQGMPAQPGPGGLSPMADPNATGGAPAPGADPAMMGGDPAAMGGDPAAAGGAPGGDAGGLPPEVMQIIQQIPPEMLMEIAAQELAMGGQGGGAPAGGGDPAAAAAGGQPQAPAQRPVARRRRAKGDFGGKKAKPFTSEDADYWEERGESGDEEDSAFGGKKAPPFGSKDSRRRHAEFPPQDGPPAGPPPGPEGGEDLDAIVDDYLAFCDHHQVDDADPSSVDAYLEATGGDEVAAQMLDEYVDAANHDETAPPQDGPPQDGPPKGDGGNPFAKGGDDDPAPKNEKEAAYLRWAARHNLPLNVRTARLFVAESRRGRRPFVATRTGRPRR